MNVSQRHRVFLMVAVLTGGILFNASSAFAGHVTISGAFHFRGIQGPNSVGFAQGDRLVLGANNVNPTVGTTVTATQGSTTLNLVFTGDALIPNQFARTIPYNPGLTGAWTIVATNGGHTATAVTTAVGSVGPLPFVRNVRITGTGLTPTIAWDLPVGSSEPFVRVGVGVFDDVTNERIFLLLSLVPSTTNFAIPAGLLVAGGQYVFRVLLENTAGGFLVNRSTAFINFQPLPAGAPPVVFMPTVDGGVYTFDFDVVDGQLVFIDPLVAIGYEYEIGDGDPNFASVLLPEAGDNVFILEFDNGSGTVTETVIAGNEFAFPAGGVDKFTVLDIEPEAALDPNAVTAFITGLTFTGTGQFTGMMTPITFNTGTAIDIKPGSDRNPINPRSKGVIPVAILTTDDFDAQGVDPITVAFGPDKAGIAHSSVHLEDVDGDDALDLVLHFRTQDTGIQCGDTAASLTGETFDGVLFEESDSIVTVGCK